MIFNILTILIITGIFLFALYELYGFIYRVTHPTPHPSTLPGMKYDPVKQLWIDKEGLPYGCARVPVRK
jgi:hypothetical protein